MASVKLVPVCSDDGSILLYDIYVEDKWIGSRRLVRYCKERLRFEGIAQIDGEIPVDTNGRLI